VKLGTREVMSIDDELKLLACGEVSIKGRIPRSSNATFLAEVTLDGETALAVYKPAKGERPLWDFPPNLFRREVAAYLLSKALGWNLVPPTIEREGPFGEGSLQRFVEADFEQHYFTLREDAAHHERLKQICLFDLLANNADRKSGHCLLASDGLIYAIDNALTFHAEPKLRTVIWEFGGQPIPKKTLSDVKRAFASGMPAPLAELLEPEEQEALLESVKAVLKQRKFPKDASGLRYPWPLI
jgi:uncharacterized repeat protein (TIGR03843 family)